jgi:hypothetical protein
MLIIENLPMTSQHKFYQKGAVSDHSINHQLHTDLKFIGNFDYLNLPNKSLWDLSPFHNCPLLFSALPLIPPTPYT